MQQQQQERPLKRQRLAISIPESVTDDTASDLSLRSGGACCALPSVLKPLFGGWNPSTPPTPIRPLFLQERLLL